MTKVRIETGSGIIGTTRKRIDETQWHVFIDDDYIGFTHDTMRNAIDNWPRLKNATLTWIGGNSIHFKSGYVPSSIRNF